MPIRPMHLASLALLAIAVNSVQAQSTASVTASPLNYTLTDLDPNDGIAPSFTWVDQLSESFGSHGVQRGDVFGTPTYVKVFEKTGTSTLGGNTQVGNANVQASTQSATLATSLSIPSGATAGAYALQGGHFQLGANTSVTFNVTVAATVTGTTPAYAPEPNGYFDWAYFQTEAHGELGRWLDGYPPYSVFGPLDARVSAFVRSGEGLHDASDSENRTLSFTITNNTATSLLSSVASKVGVSSYTVVTQVPEAGSFAQFAVGLAFTGGLLANRRRLSAKRLS